MKKVLILEDNLQALKVLEKIAGDSAPDVLPRPASNVASAYHMAMEQDISLFLIDIILDITRSNDTSGIRFAEKMRSLEKYRFTPIIFATSLEDPRLHAYSHIHCYGYLEKPYNHDTVRKLVAEALKFPGCSDNEKEKYIYFRKDGILYPRKHSEIVYLENVGRQLTIYTSDGGQLHMPYRTCAALLEDLGSKRFVQCSRSTILNRDYIDNIDIQNRYVRLRRVDTIIEIGTIMKKKFLKEIEDG